MKPIKIALAWPFILYICYAGETETTTKTLKSIIIKNNEDLKTICNKHKCLPKCCNETDYIGRNEKCVPYKGNFDFSNVTVYTDDIYETGKSLQDLFYLVPGKYSNKTFEDLALDVTKWGLNTYLTEDGIVYLETPNAFPRWTPLDTHRFCVEFKQPYKRKNTPATKFFVVIDDEYVPKSNGFYTAALLISCVFLALTLLVYALLPELRNLCGMVLMAYVASQFGAFLVLAVIQIGIYPVSVCLGLTFSAYFFFLSSFCWMNVMSIDIWWTFRSYDKSRPLHRRGKTFKFLMYCSYAWGLPLAMTIALAILNEIDVSHLPWFITPNIPNYGCFLEGGEKLLYLYVPMLIIIMCNWIFFLMTAFNIWHLNRGMAVLNTASTGIPAVHLFQRHRFLVYLKMSVIMGINWILEVVSLLKPQLQIWYFTDAYNLLIGLAIFIIFVCKRKIYLQLQKKFRN